MDDSYIILSRTMECMIYSKVTVIHLSSKMYMALNVMVDGQEGVRNTNLQMVEIPGM